MSGEPPTSDGQHTETSPVRGERADETNPGVSTPPSHLVIEGYEIVRELHRGGQGVVYEALQKSAKRKVAVKVLLVGRRASKSAQKRFEREIELVAQLKHPNIISIFDSGTTADGLPYYAMDYVRGRPLHHHVRDHRLPLEETLRLFSKVCQAIQYAHQRGVIHRDLKPTNILVDTDGSPKVLDFGLAKLLAGPIDTIVSLTEEVIGTLPYMSPEQARGNPDEIDTRTDIYSLGVILYELLTGHYPYPVVGNIADVLKNIAETPPTPASRNWSSEFGITKRSDRRLRPGSCPIDGEVETIVLKTLAKERERRYQSAGDLAVDIKHYLSGEPIEARRDSGWYILKKNLRRHRYKIGVTAGFLVVAVTCGVLLRRAAAEKNAQRLVLEAVRDMELRQYSSAYSKFRDVIAADPDNYRALANAAIILKEEYFDQPFNRTDRSELSMANEYLERALKVKPDHAGIWNIQAVVAFELGRLQDAEAACRTALQLDPEYYWAESNLAKVLAVQGQVDEALEAAKHGTSIAAGKERNAYADGIWLTLGVLQLHMGDEDALRSLQTARDIDPKDPDNHLLLARLYLTLPGHTDYPLALDEAKVADTLHNGPDPRFDRILALGYLRNDGWSDAARHAQAALDGGDLTSYGHLIEAIAEARMNNHASAQAHLDDAIKYWPKEFAIQDYVVHARREVLWFDAKNELESLRIETQKALSGLQP